MYSSLPIKFKNKSNLNVVLTLITGGFVSLFCLFSFFYFDTLKHTIEILFTSSVTFFGAFWQTEVVLTFLIAIGLCFFKGSQARLGRLEKPEFTVFQWASMIMCTLLAGGGVFWAAGEPVWHFLNPPPNFAVTSGTSDAVSVALAQSFLHWGFLAWSILGSLSTILLMYYHYEKGLPLAPRTLLYPLFGKYVISGPLGLFVDASAIIAVVAGTVGPIGFLGLQVSSGLETLFNIKDTFSTQAIIIISIVILYTISSITGLKRGIQFLSRANIILAVVLLVFFVLVGPTLFIIKNFYSGLWMYLTHFFDMVLYREGAGVFGEVKWLGSWTIFFWGWFMGYGPMMAMFIARISRGRSIRSILIMISIVAPLVTNAWFSIIGGSGIAFELQNPGVISSAIEGFDLPAALLAIASQLPLGFILSILLLVLTTVFVATTGDSMTYMISIAVSKNAKSSLFVRAFWGVAMGVIAVILIALGDSGVSELQNFIVITAVPVSFILLPSLWDAIRITLLKGKEISKRM